jgi:hypothetical protein
VDKQFCEKQCREMAGSSIQKMAPFSIHFGTWGRGLPTKAERGSCGHELNDINKLYLLSGRRHENLA